MIHLRPNQTEARHAINALANAGRHPLFVSPTGTGKTRTASAVISDRVRLLNRRVFVLTPSMEVFGQWLAELSRAKLNPGYINQDGVRGRNRSVYVCMPLSLVNLLDRLPETFAPDEIVIDEAQHSLASSWETIYTHFDRAIRIGLTATPYRMDNKPLGAWYTDIVQTITPREAIDAGYLAEPLVIVPEEYRLTVPLNNGELDPEDQAAALGEPRIIGNMIERYGEMFAGLPVLVACCTYEHARQVTEAFNAEGWRFEHINSLLPDYARERMLRDIRRPAGDPARLNGLCTVGIGIEGMDIPGLYGLIWMRRTMSLTIYLQFIGRVLRPMPGKRYGIILDGVGNTFIHGRPELDRAWSLTTDYAPAPEDELTAAPTMKLCPACGVMNALENVACHLCGLVFNSDEAAAIRAGMVRKYPAMVDGELVVLSADERAERVGRVEEIRAGNIAAGAAGGAGQKGGTADGPELVPVTREEKVDVLSKGLTGRGVRTMFKETLREFV
jgi:superfamily II DNA or RNA helicase